ncbi:helix-turn-helix transcriptional regulator [Rhizobium sp. OAE497]|uniref:helix-turn-helix domain-containing protein n=1 Tax=Rhizobium sp. OAE497 TaxID=2663796 RepID=UPI0018F55DBA
MITNERQYRITRSQADRFKKALTEFSLQKREGVHPRLVQAEREALESQISDLELELANFDSLKSQDLAMISLDSFDGLAEGLIKARIASGLSQRDLADRLGLKEQQIQRYEADRYGSASLQRVQEIAQAIGVRIQNEIMLPIPAVSFDSLVAKLRQVGLDRDFVLTRLLPSSDRARLSGEADVEDQSQILQRTGEILQRIFGWTRENLFGPSVLQSPQLAAAHARFKMPANRSQKTTTAYAAYAHYLALTVLRASAEMPRRPIPIDPTVFRQGVIDAYGEFELRSALHYAWDLGVPVLPLRDRGTFHGACWRYNHRNIVVLKQTSAFEARWLFDLLHELFHAGQEPEAATLEIIEGDETSAERRNSDEEIAASQFAGDASLDGRAEELAQACVEAARGSVQRLKMVVPQIAEDYDVSVGALANYMAFRLSWQGVNWWGAAANLQTGDADPWRIARDVFLERFPAIFESEIDRNLLERVLH